jgi:copper resistance protein D
VPLAATTFELSLHLIAAAVYVGGVVFLGLAAASARATVSPRERIALFRLLGQRFLLLSGGALLILIGTGAAMAADGDYGERLNQKLGVVAIAVALTYYHSFIQGPTLSRVREQALDRPGDADLAAEIRRLSAQAGIVQALILVSTLASLVMAARLTA